MDWTLVCAIPSDNGLIYCVCWSNNEQYIAISSSSGLCQ